MDRKGQENWYYKLGSCNWKMDKRIKMDRGIAWDKTLRIQEDKYCDSKV